MLENLCTLPLSDDIFTLAVHPERPLLAVGLSTGHVECFRLPSRESRGDDASAASGRGAIETAWRTRRHKGSCRTLALADDSSMYSAGTDGLLKHFEAETGVVKAKIAIPTGLKTHDLPSLIRPLNPHTLLLGCDSGALHLLDTRDGSPKPRPARTHHPHNDYVSSMVPMPPSAESTSGFPKQWVSTGDTTVVLTDLRMGVVVRSEDQEDELLCARFVEGLGPKGHRDGVLAVGCGTGVVTLWDKGVWDDQTERVVVDSVGGAKIRTRSMGVRKGGECVDAMAQVPDGVGWGGKKLVVGMGDGAVKLVDLARKELVGGTEFRHDDIEGVVAMDWDAEDRLITAGGKNVKIWEDNGDSGESDSDESDGEEAVGGKRSHESDDSDSSAEEAKRKRVRKDVRNKLGPMGAHGVLGFEGID